MGAEAGGAMPLDDAQIPVLGDDCLPGETRSHGQGVVSGPQIIGRYHLREDAAAVLTGHPSPIEPRKPLALIAGESCLNLHRRRAVASRREPQGDALALSRHQHPGRHEAEAMVDIHRLIPDGGFERP